MWRSRPWWSHLMVYGYGCVLVFRPNRFMKSTEMRLFWLPMLTMNYSGEPFTHICEWKRRSPSSGSSGTIFWILVVAMMALSSTSMIYFPLSVPLSGYDSESKLVSDSEAFSSATSDYLARNSLVLRVELLCNLHHFPVSLFVFMVLFFSCDFNGIS